MAKKVTRELPSNDEFNQIKEEIKQSSNIPTGYIPVRLSSKGKVGAPELFHVRCFNMEELLELGSQVQDNSLTTTLKVLDNMIYEDIDLYKFSSQELIETLMTLHANFVSKVLKDYQYKPTEEELQWLKDNDQERLNLILDGKHTLTVNIDIEDDIQIKDMTDKFKGSIIFKDLEVTFRLERAEDGIIINSMINKKYGTRMIHVEKVKKLLQREKITGQVNGSITQEQRQNVKDLNREIGIESLKLLSASLISSYKGEDLEGNIEKKLEAYYALPPTVWEKLSSVVEKDLKYGVQHEVVVKSPITGNEVERRFQFRPLDFIPRDGKLKPIEYDISFG